MKQHAFVTTVNQISPGVLGTHPVVSSIQSATEKVEEVNEVTHEESVQTSTSLAQKFTFCTILLEIE